MCREIAGEYSTLARERIAEEFMKWTASGHPGRIAEYLTATGWIVHSLRSARWQAFRKILTGTGGDVGTHTMLVVDAAARVAKREGLEGDARAVVLLSALCHDFAKPATTQLRDRDGKMRWTSWGHEAAGGPWPEHFWSVLESRAQS